jgi:hypothetical protein
MRFAGNEFQHRQAVARKSEAFKPVTKERRCGLSLPTRAVKWPCQCRIRALSAPKKEPRPWSRPPAETLLLTAPRDQIGGQVSNARQRPLACWGAVSQGQFVVLRPLKQKAPQ